MSRAELLGLSLKGLLAWSVLSVFGWYFGEALGTGLLPWFEVIIHQVRPDYSPWLKLIPEHHDFTIHLNVTLVNRVLLGGQLWLKAGRELTAGTHLMHTLVPMVIELSILLVWPVNGWRQRLMLLSLGLVTSMLVVGATAPFVLLGNIEIYLQTLAQQVNVHRPVPWTLTWMIFSEMGGRWVLPIIAALVCIRLQRRFFNKTIDNGPHSAFETVPAGIQRDFEPVITATTTVPFKPDITVNEPAFIRVGPHSIEADQK